MDRKRIWGLLCLCGLLICNTAVLGASSIRIERVASGLDSPVTLAHAGDGSKRLFIVQQGGQIVIFTGSQVLGTPFLDIQAKVSCCGERGLLGLAFHPDYKNNGQFYVNYTNIAGDTVVARYTVSNDANVADPASEQILLTIDQPFSNHNGGQISFGPDGYLYIGMGDGGSAGDPGNRAQDLSTLLGKMLRIDVNNGSPYGIPADNPFVGQVGALPEIWAYGLRNPWRFSFDRANGDLFIGDVGQGSWEEIDFQAANSPGGENYGWRLMEGTHCFNPDINCNDGSLTLPILEYSHALGCSVTGGFSYRGTQYKRLQGTYFYGDYCSGRIWGATPDGNGQWTTQELLDTNLQINTFGEDEDGELYLVYLSGGQSELYRIGANFTISPGTARYTSSQAFDLSYMLYPAGISITATQVVLDGRDITSMIQSCVVPGNMSGGGLSFRCPRVPLSLLSPGDHELSIDVDLSDGTSLGDTVTWQVLRTRE